MDRQEKLEKITEVFEGLIFDRIIYNESYDCFELHFKNDKYFTLGLETKLNVQFRKVWINPKLKKEHKKNREEEMSHKKTIHSDCPLYTSEECELDGNDWCPMNCIVYTVYKEELKEESE